MQPTATVNPDAPPQSKSKNDRKSTEASLISKKHSCMFHTCLISIFVLGIISVITLTTGLSKGLDAATKLSNDTIAGYSQGVRITEFALSLYSKPLITDLEVVRGECPDGTISLSDAIWPGTNRSCTDFVKESYFATCKIEDGKYTQMPAEQMPYPGPNSENICGTLSEWTRAGGGYDGVKKRPITSMVMTTNPRTLSSDFETVPEPIQDPSGSNEKYYIAFKRGDEKD